MASEYEYLLAVGKDRNPAQETRFKELSAGRSSAGGVIPDYSAIYKQADADLDAYYKRILAEEGGDVERAKARLFEDYQRGNRISIEDYAREIGFATEEAQAAQAELRPTEIQEARTLEGGLARRGVSEGGLAEGQRGELGTRQALRREAIDRALRKSTELSKTAKERSMEEQTISQRRGAEDVASQFAKFVTDKQQERQEKALSLAEQKYQREFGAKSAAESFRLQQEGLDISRRAIG